MSSRSEKLIDLNVSGRVLLLCLEHGITEAPRIAIFKRAVRAAVAAELRGKVIVPGVLEAVLAGQILYLGDALRTVKHHILEEAGDKEAKAAEEKEIEEALAKPKPQESPVISRAQEEVRPFEEKLDQSRTPLRKLILEDCVQVGIVDRSRAKELVKQLAGKLPGDAEAEVVTELRNNLHQQVREFIRKNKGGPWPKPQVQEELRIDIVKTNKVSDLLMLTRQLLRERSIWTDENNKGFFQSITTSSVKASSW